MTGSEFFPQGVLLSWTKKFKARGVQDTDVVSHLTKAMKNHKVGICSAPSPSRLLKAGHTVPAPEGGQGEEPTSGEVSLQCRCHTSVKPTGEPWSVDLVPVTVESGPHCPGTSPFAQPLQGSWLDSLLCVMLQLLPLAEA